MDFLARSAEKGPHDPMTAGHDTSAPLEELTTLLEVIPFHFIV
jgi:hypothetical protein